MVAHKSFCRALFFLRASERCFAPSAPSRLSLRLRVRVHSGCQRLLTVENRVCGGALERLEGRVLLAVGAGALAFEAFEAPSASTQTDARERFIARGESERARAVDDSRGTASLLLSAVKAVCVNPHVDRIPSLRHPMESPPRSASRLGSCTRVGVAVRTATEIGVP